MPSERTMRDPDNMQDLPGALPDEAPDGVPDEVPDALADPAQSAPPARAETRSVLAAAALFLVGFAVVALLLHLTLRDPLHLHADLRSEKLYMLEHAQGPVDSAAFGSSHLHNGFDPRVFDRDLAGTPLATHTLNLAVSGGSQAEQRVMAMEFLRRLKAPARPEPCLVILELTAGANFQSMHLVHPRAINVYDWDTTHFVSQLTVPTMPLKQRVGRTGYAVVAMGLHYANVGMVSNKIFSPPVDAELVASQTADDRRGINMEPDNPAYMTRMRKFVAEHPGPPATAKVELTPGNAELIDELAAGSPVPNVSFAYVVFPMVGDLAQMPEYPDHLETAGRMVPIINLGRPDRFPELYRPELWHDDAHFNGTGAAAATRVLADQMKLWYSTHGAPPACGKGT